MTLMYLVLGFTGLVGSAIAKDELSNLRHNDLSK